MIFIILIGIVLFIIVFVRLSDLNSKIEALSKQIKHGSVAQTSTPHMHAAPTPAPAPVPVKPAETVYATAATSAPAPTPVPEKMTTDNSSTEFAFGAKILTGVGIIAVLLGVGFFLRYAFENNLISEGARVGMGVVFGIILIGVGAYLYKKFAAYAQGLMGAGLGVLYISLYSAYSFYSIIDAATAFVLLIVVAALGIFLSIKYNSEALMGYSFFGAYIVPLLLLPFSSNPHATFMYLIVLAITASVLSFKKAYSWLSIGSFIATFLIYAFWQVSVSNTFDASTILTYSSILFLIYIASNVHALIAHTTKDIDPADLALAILAPVFFYITNINVVTSHFENGQKLFVFFIACFYIVASLLVRVLWNQIETSKRASNTLFVIAIPFLAIATALHFNGQWISIMWLIEAAIIIGLGTQTKTAMMRYFGLGLYFFSIIRAFLFDFGLPPHSDFIFNSRTLLALVLIAVSLSLWYVYKIILSAKIAGEGMTAEDESMFGRNLGLVIAYGSFIVWIISEFAQFNHTGYISIVFAICALIGVASASAIKESLLRHLAYAVLVITYGDMLFRYLFGVLGEHVADPIANLRVLSMIVIIAVSATILYLTGKENAEEKKTLSPVLFTTANILFFIVLSQEVLFYLDSNARALGFEGSTLENTKRISLSLAWMAYAVIMLGIGIFKRYASARIVAIVLFAITILKVFLYDTANLSDIYRFISFISLGIILLLVGFAYYRFKDRVLEFMQAK